MRFLYLIGLSFWALNPVHTEDLPSSQSERNDQQKLSVEEVLEQAYRENRQANQRTLRQAQFHYQTAQKLYQQNRLNEAQRELEKALQYNPNDTAARQLLVSVESALGLTPAIAKDAAQHNADRAQAERTQQILMVQQRLAQARHNLELGKLDQAEQEANAALDAIRLLPYYFNADEERRLGQSLKSEITTARQDQNRLEKQLIDERSRSKAESDLLTSVKLLEAQIQALFKEAVASFEAHDFDNAVAISDQILRLDPENKHAEDLRDRARHNELISDKRRIQLEHDRGKRSVKSYVADQFLVPDPSEPLHFPEGFQEKVRARDARRLRTFQEVEPDWKRTMREQLEQPISMVFADDPFENVKNFIELKSGLPVMWDSDLGDIQDFDVTGIDLQGLPLRSALDWLARYLELKWTLRHHAIFFTSPDGLVEEGVTLTYDVRDLAFELNDFEAPELSLGNAEDGVVIQAPSEENTTVEVDDLVEMIQESIQPDSWESEGTNYNITPRGGSIVVTHTPEVHRELQDLIDELRAQRALQVSIQARFLVINDFQVDLFGVDWRGLNSDPRNPFIDGSTVPLSPTFGPLNLEGELIEDLYLRTGTANNGIVQSGAGFITKGNGRAFARGRVENFFRQGISLQGVSMPSGAVGVDMLDLLGGTAVAYTFLSNFQLEAIMRGVHNDVDATILTAPMIMCYNTQRANISVLSQQAYIRDVTAVVTVQAFAFDPEIGFLQTGLTMDVRPVVSHDRKYITLDLRPTIADLDDVRTIGIASLASGTPQIEAPQIGLQSVRTTVSVPDGGTIMIGGLSQGRQVKEHAGVPIVSKIPILNAMVGQSYKQDETQTQLILVTARVIDQSEIEGQLYGVQ